MHYSEFFQILKDSNYLSFCQQKQSENLIKKPGDNSVEEHHIYLRSFEDGKVDLPENLVYLSIADHIKAHLILVQDLENLGISGHAYYSALKSINITFNTRYELLTESERVDLEKSIPEITLLRQKAKDRFQKEAQRIKKEKYGNVMGMCHTEEVKARARETNLKKYGYGNGALGLEENKQKALEGRMRKYNGDVMGQCHTKEAFAKSKETRIKKYGSPMGACHTSEAVTKRKEKLKLDQIQIEEKSVEKTNKQSFSEKKRTLVKVRKEQKEKALDKALKKYTLGELQRFAKPRDGANRLANTWAMNTPEAKDRMREAVRTPESKAKRIKTFTEKYGSIDAKMNSPEAKEKALVSRKRNMIKLKHFISTNESFKEWFEENKNNFYNRNPIIGARHYLKIQNKTVWDLPEVSEKFILFE